MLNLGQRANYALVTAPTPRICGENDFRDLVHHSQLGEVINTSVGGASPMPSGYEPAVQVVLPYFGLFDYAVGKRSWLVDTSKILLIQPGWEFADGQPVEGLGHASLLINPAESLMEELTRSPSFARSGSSLFGTVCSSPEIWLMTQYLLAKAEEDLTPLEADEWLIRVLELAVDRPRRSYRPAPRTVARAKEYLHAHGYERVPLQRIAKAVGVSPVYLTNEFARSEGIPLYQYQLNLRLIRALQQLPECNDITQLALEMGFSSHSHFSAAFRRTFGLAPSLFRSKTRARRSPVCASPSFRPGWDPPCFVGTTTPAAVSRDTRVVLSR